MLANEALEVLALRPGATPVQIKEAYRDLVKVWHPDRFGSDARLRVKAEEKLQRINEAYRVLDAGAAAGSAVKTASMARGDVSSPRYSSYAPVVGRSGGGSNRAVMGLFYVCVAISVALVGYLAIANTTKITEPTVPAVALNPVAPRTPGGVSGGRVARPAEANPRASDAGSSTGAGVAPFRVRSLSEAETERLEEACEPQRDRLGQTAYQVCMAAQVGLMTNPVRRPDLSALNGAERESIESACGEAQRVGGVDGYDRCLTVKIAEWAAEPARPVLSTLNEADRRSVELACKGARDVQGPAAYDRCLVRFMKALADSR